MGTPPTCPRDAVPLDLHGRCWACQALAGRGHPAGNLQLGLCQPCRESLARWTSARPWPGRTATDAPAPDGLIDSREAGRMLGVSPDTIRGYASAGRLRALPLESASGDRRGRRLRFRRADVLRLLKGRPPTPPNSPPPDGTRA